LAVWHLGEDAATSSSAIFGPRGFETLVSDRCGPAASESAEHRPVSEQRHVLLRTL